MLARARAAGATHLIALPLYPQYSFATTRSSVGELRRLIDASAYRPVTAVVDEHADNPRYIEALVDVTRRALRDYQAPQAEIHLIFSAHGLPVSYIDKGDPYLDHVRRTMAATLATLRHPGPTHLSFQSRLGPQVWLKPSTDELLKELGAAGARAVCIVPVAFVTEHVETLNEIDIQYREIAAASGLKEFGRACAVKCHPEYVRALADLAENALAKIADKETGAGE
jgi:ferrochelatase